MGDKNAKPAETVDSEVLVGAGRSLLKIVQVVPRIATLSSGPSLSVPSLCVSLNELGHQVQLFTLEPRPSRLMFNETRFFPCANAPFAHRLGISPAMKEALRNECGGVDIVHTNSLWMMPNIYPGTIDTKEHYKLVISPRGTLSRWALSRSRVRKWVVWNAGQRHALGRADCIHVTSTQEMEEVRDLGFKSPIAVIPNGVSCPSDLKVKPSERNERTCLFLARIHPKKGLDRLLEAWRLLTTSFPDWHLKIAGPLDNDYAQRLVEKVEAAGPRNVQFLGEVVGQEKSDLFYSSDLYVLPTHSENFGISVAEALGHGLPSIVYQGAPWSGMDEKRAGWWIEPRFETLVETMKYAMDLSDEQREQMGSRAHNWIKSEFGWKEIGRRVDNVYQWLKASQSNPPDDVHLLR